MTLIYNVQIQNCFRKVEDDKMRELNFRVPNLEEAKLILDEGNSLVFYNITQKYQLFLTKGLID